MLSQYCSDKYIDELLLDLEICQEKKWPSVFLGKEFDG